MALCTDLIILNFEEARRRSKLIWAGLPTERYFWKPDEEAMHCLEMIRHVLWTDHWWHYIITHRGDVSKFKGHWDDFPYDDLQHEYDFAAPYRDLLLREIRTFSDSDLQTIEIVRANGNRRFLGDYLLRAAYHEAVHAGNFLSYLRAMGVDRPYVWD